MFQLIVLWLNVQSFIKDNHYIDVIFVEIVPCPPNFGMSILSAIFKFCHTSGARWYCCTAHFNYLLLKIFPFRARTIWPWYWHRYNIFRSRTKQIQTRRIYPTIIIHLVQQYVMEIRLIFTCTQTHAIQILIVYNNVSSKYFHPINISNIKSNEHTHTHTQNIISCYSFADLYKFSCV